ncbi:hypothetical protein FRC15_011442 [Serendipita sp. 397]|nr:hypothetical protein FRC15_011442 [Serendipita sp. 397]
MIGAFKLSALAAGMMASTLFSQAVDALTPQPKKFWFSFGDSYTQSWFNVSDPNGQPSLANPMGNPPYPGYTACGFVPNWVYQSTFVLNSSFVYVYNHAYGGAVIDETLVTPWQPGLKHLGAQVQDFLDYNAPGKKFYPGWTSENTIFPVWIGINDLGNSYWIHEDYAAFNQILVNRYFEIISQTVKVGARNFMFVTVPPTERSPLMLNIKTDAELALLKKVRLDYNAKVRTAAKKFEKDNKGVKALLYETDPVFKYVLDNPSCFARNHLRLPNNAPVPDSYVLVLEKFLKAYPEDLNFIIHHAFSGSVLKCLEVGCEGVALNMGRQSGQSAGCIATLEPYKQHIRTHPTHTISRNNRIRRKSGPNMDMRGSVAPGRVIAILDDTFTRQPSLSPPRPTTSNYLVRKRASDPVCIEISDSDSESPPAKRPRIDSSLKQPLGDVDRNTPMVSLDADPKSRHQTPSRLNTVPGYNPLIGGQAIDAHAYIPGGYVNQVNGRHRPLNLIVPAPSLWLHEEDSGDALYDSGSDGPEDFSQRQGNLIMPGPVSGFSSRGDWEVPTARLADQRIKNFLEHYDQESFGGQKTVQDGLVALNLPELGATLPGMQTALLAHQVIGVSWMLQREREDAKWARGGILADAMGLGKTVQSIGVICANPSTDPGCAATLIVAPLALLEQWKQEISWKCEEGTFNVLIYHGPNRPKNKHEIMKYDIVLTTYHTLGNEWETEKKTRKGKKSDEGSVNDEGTEDRTTKKRKVGPLMDIHWYRVILDEAQFIRNPRTKASSIVTHLIADIKWCLTGTPFTNGLKDVFGFLRFIEHNPFADWDRFRGLIRGHEDERAAKNVQQALAGVLFRRTKESKLDGKPIITLPPRNESWHTLEFQPEERQIYDFVEKKLQAVFNRFLQAGTVLKNYSEVA